MAYDIQTPDTAASQAAPVASPDLDPSTNPVLAQPTNINSPDQDPTSFMNSQPDNSAPAQAQQPSLFRNLLAGAMLGFARGMGEKTPGAGMAAGAEGAVNDNLNAQKLQLAKAADARQQQVAQSQIDTAKATQAHMHALTAQAAHDLAVRTPGTNEHRDELLEQQGTKVMQAVEAGTASIMPGTLSDDAMKTQQFIHDNFVAKGDLSVIPTPVLQDGKTMYGGVRWLNAKNTQPVTVNRTLPDGTKQDVTMPPGSVDGTTLGQFVTTDFANRASVIAKNAEANNQAKNAKDLETYKQGEENKRAAATRQTDLQKSAVASGQATPVMDEKGNVTGIKPINGTGPEWKPKVSADEKKKAELAENIAFNANEVNTMLTRRPDIVGVVGGRFTNVKQMIGNNDPDISAIGNHIHNIAMANSGVHGFRSQEGVEETEKNLINSFKNGPTAVAGALNANVTSVQTFIDNARPSSYGTHSGQGGAGGYYSKKAGSSTSGSSVPNVPGLVIH